MKHWIIYSVPENYQEIYELKTLVQLGEVYKFGEWEGVVVAENQQEAIREKQQLDQNKKYEAILYCPKEEMPATYNIGSDCYPLTIRKVSKSGKIIWLSKELTKNYDENNLIKATLRKNGMYKKVGKNYGTIYIGYHKKYHDPSF